MEVYNRWEYELVDSIKDKFKTNQNLKGNVNTALSKVYHGNQRMQGLEKSDKDALKNIFGLSDDYFNGDEDTSKQNLIAFINTINEGLPTNKRIIIPNVEKSSTNVIDDVPDDEGGFFGAWFGDDGADGDYGGSKMRKRKTKRRKTNKKSKRKRRKTRRRQR